MIDIIIPTRNAEKDLANCLEGLQKQTVPVHVIIVDAHSTDRTVEIAHKFGATILMEPASPKPVNNHLALAKNFGIKHAISPFVAFIDSDVTVSPDWADSMSEALTTQDAVATTSGCTSSSTPLGQAIQTVLRYGSSSHVQQFKETKQVESAPGYNTIYKREVLLSVGGFDESLEGCEDWELNYRLRRKGWKILGIPYSPVEHRQNYTIPSFAKQMFGYAWSRSHLYRRKGMFSLRHTLPSLSLIPLLVFLLLFPHEFLFATALFSITWLFSTVSPRLYLTVLAFMVFWFSWAFGYLKGLLTHYSKREEEVKK